jgi:GPH family glycoside/pentoside/hexuronide:cation symporter
MAAPPPSTPLRAETGMGVVSTLLTPPHADRTPAARLSFAVKVCYSLGSLCESIKAFSFGMFLLFFYTSVLGLPGTLVGIATAVGLAWDSIIDPFVGHLSDRARPRFGRRHSFMLAGAVCMGVSFMLIFNPPSQLPTAGLFAWLLVTNLCLRTTTSIFMVPYYALGAELSQDYDERTSISAYRAAAALAGTLLAAVASFGVIFASGVAGQADPKFDPAGYAAMGVAFGVATMIAGLVATFGTRSARGAVQPVADAALAGASRFGAELRSSLAEPALRALVVSASLFFLASVINASLALHYLTYYAGVPDSGSIVRFQLAFYLGALVGVPVWLRAARVVDKHHLYCGATLATATLVAAAYWLVGEGRPFGVGNLTALQWGNALAGLCASALWVLVPAMLADVAGENAFRTGKRRDGVVFGIYSLGQQTAATVAILASGVLIDRFAGLVPGQAAQSGATIQRVAVVYSLLPAALLVIAAALILRYDITRRRVARSQSRMGVA